MTSTFKDPMFKSKNGFTTIEIAIVLLISGLMFTMAMQYYGIVKNRQAYDATKERQLEIDDALTSMMGIQGHLPCPADPTLPPTHPDYGKALPVCDICIDETTRPFLSDGVTPSNVICTSEGTRDIDGDGNNEFVLIGALPFKSLYEATALLPVPFNQASGVDGYNNLYTYAVTEEMTSNSYTPINPVNPYIGAVHMIDENGVEMSDPPSSAQYVLVSHGKNGQGAYTMEGTRIDNCLVSSTSLPPTPGYQPFGSVAGLNPDIENCDNNDGVYTKALLSLNDEDSYFDDIVFFRNRSSTGLWRGSPGANTHIYNANLGDVGIDTTNPMAKLHVVGNVRADEQVRAEQGYCDVAHVRTGTASDLDCMMPELLTNFDNDPALRWACDEGEAAIGIQSNQVVCEDLIPDPATVNFNVTCPANEYPTGLRYDRVANEFTASGCATP